MGQLGSHIIDSYLIVLYALEVVIIRKKAVKEVNLLEQIHLAIIEMYNENLIPKLQSCLKVTIKTALHRFVALGMADLHTYLHPNGSRVSYVFSGKLEDQLKIVLEN